MSDRRETLYWSALIGGKIRERRKQLGLRLEDLSLLSGSSVPTLSHIERGQRDVKLSTLVALCAALRTDLPSLLENGEKSARPVQPGGPVGYDLDEDL